MKENKISQTDQMIEDEIREGLTTKIIGKKIFCYAVLDSTNEVCFKLGERGAEEGVCVFSEFQKKGRGRLGRGWVSPKGKNILMSVLLRPRLTPSELPRVTLAAALSVVRAVHKTTGKNIGIRWPNDLLYRGKKMGGILTQMCAEADRVHFVVVGIGLNVHSGPEELPPGSISVQEISARPVSRVLLARDLIQEFEKDTLRLKHRRFEELAEEWERYSVTSGERVSVALMGRKLQGEAMGIDADGALWIRKDNGLQEKVVAGDVELLRQK